MDIQKATAVEEMDEKIEETIDEVVEESTEIMLVTFVGAPGRRNELKKRRTRGGCSDKSSVA